MTVRVGAGSDRTGGKWEMLGGEAGRSGRRWLRAISQKAHSFAPIFCDFLSRAKIIFFPNRGIFWSREPWNRRPRRWTNQRASFGGNGATRGSARRSAADGRDEERRVPPTTGDAFTRARRLARRARRAHRRDMLAANISAMSGAATMAASARARRAASPRVASPVAGSAVSASAFRTGRRLAGASHPRASPSRARRGLGVFAQATQDDGATSLAVPEDDSIQVRPTPGRTRSARPMRRPRISILFTSVRFPPT